VYGGVRIFYITHIPGPDAKYGAEHLDCLIDVAHYNAYLIDPWHRES
jgi:hypothetical protein